MCGNVECVCSLRHKCVNVCVGECGYVDKFGV